MAIRLRLARHHLTRNAPTYSLVAIHSSARTTARPVETLGRYSPIPTLVAPPSRSPNGHLRNEQEWGPRQFKPVGARAPVGQKKVEWNEDRVRWWLSQGALPSKTVERLLVQAGILDTDPRPTPAENGKMVISRQRRIREAVRKAEQARAEKPVAERA
ncbi:hypothetical protein JCM5296_004510 [Sporobolomyces johnsonii]